MKTIYKYPLNKISMVIEDHISEWLDIQYQDQWPTIWALIDTDKEKRKFQVQIYGTGWVIDEDCGTYLKTLQDKGGYVWHFFIKQIPLSETEN